MRTEEHLIPFENTDLTGRRVLVLAPHPDDETLGCGGSLRLHADAGDSVKIVFLTDGAKGDATGQAEKSGYVAARRKEAERACEILGIADLEFWLYEDRALSGARGAVPRMIDLLNEYGPELVYVPSPMEFHPDHRAACFLLSDAISGVNHHFQVAFYELGQPVRVNTLVDITSVLAEKNRAISCYESQLRERPYGDIIEGLNRYRSMTLPEGATHAEGFLKQSSHLIGKSGPLSIPFFQLERLAPDPGNSGPLVSVIIRTKNRPNLLANAIRSVVQQTYANLEVVVVNDGGEDVEDVVRSLSGNTPFKCVTHSKCMGRAAAANSGLKAAKGKYLNFLDDDDVLYPDHLRLLAGHLETTRGMAAFGNVLNVFYGGPPDNPGNRQREELVFNFDYDPDRLLFENYIPMMSVLFSREILKKISGFSEDLTLFEDWDFWVRVSRHFSFEHVDRTTAEYRFYGKEDMASSHRMKYEYDQARAVMFDRNLSYMDGQAWAAFQSEKERLSNLAEEKQPENRATKTIPCQENPDTSVLTDIHEQLKRIRSDLQRLREIPLHHHSENGASAHQTRCDSMSPGVKGRVGIGREKIKEILEKIASFLISRMRKRG